MPAERRLPYPPPLVTPYRDLALVSPCSLSDTFTGVAGKKFPGLGDEWSDTAGAARNRAVASLRAASHVRSNPRNIPAAVSPSRTLAALLVAATAVLWWAVARYPRAEMAATAAWWARQYLLQALVFASFVWLARTRAPAALAAAVARVRGRAAVVAVLLAGLVVSYLLARATTPLIPVNGGWGVDGLVYGKMTEGFGWFSTSAQGPFNKRFLVPMAVHASGLPTFTGYHLIDAVSFFACGVLVFALARRLGAEARRALVCVALFVPLKMGLRYWVHYPVLVDAPGMAFLLALVYCTVRGWNAGHAIVLAAAVFCRENLILLLPFHVLYQARGAAMARAAAWSLLPVMLLIVSLRHPVVAAVPPFSVRAELATFLHELADPDRQARIPLAYLNGLGLLLLLPVLVPAGRRALRALLRQPAWLYYAVMTLALSILGGRDVDRFATWQLPFLIAVLARLEAPAMATGASWFWAHALALHAAAMSFLQPWRASLMFGQGLTAAHGERPWYGYLLGSWILALGLAAAMVRVAASRPETAVSEAGR